VIELHDHETAPEGAKTTLAAVDRALGFTPNLLRVLANSPSTLNGFAALLDAHDSGTLSPVERQIVQLTASLENQCEYCVAGHSTFAAQMGLPSETIMAIRESRPLADKRYQGLVDFTRALVRCRGQVTDGDRAAFEASGFSSEQIFEVVAGIALKTISNFINGVFDLPLDRQFQAQAWSANSGRPAVRESNALVS
jgi:uncharacterized peroxidase-related enzyme